MGEEAIARRELTALKRRVLDLSEADRIEIVRTLTESLAHAEEFSMLQHQAEHRREALRVFQKVRNDLGLDAAGVRQLTMARFDAVDEATREGWRAARIARAFGSWHYARVVLLGEVLPMKLRQRQVAP